MNGLVFCKAFHSISESSIEPCITLSTRWLILGNIHFQDDVGGTGFLDNWNPVGRLRPCVTSDPLWHGMPISSSTTPTTSFDDMPMVQMGEGRKWTELRGLLATCFFFQVLQSVLLDLFWKTWFGGVDTNMVDTCGDLSSWKGAPVFQQYPTCLPILFCRTLEATWWIRGISRWWFSLPKIRWCLKMSQLSEPKNNMFA